MKFPHLILIAYISSFVNVNEGKATYRAAVVEFSPTHLHAEKGKPIEIMRTNAMKYAQYVGEAAGHGADIIVFPEYGLTTLDVGEDRDKILPFLQDVPDLKIGTWNPCLDPQISENTEILHILSCAAKKNSIVLVANLLSRISCNQLDPTCPADGRYQFNSNVVFARNGTLLARYDKLHLFGEHALNPAPQPKYVIVDVGFVKFATFICFDINFSDPPVKLVREFGIRNIVFTTAWNTELPFASAPQVFSRWANGIGANLIASNYHRPIGGQLGSGIYSPALGALNETYDLYHTEHLIVADVPVTPTVDPLASAQCSNVFHCAPTLSGVTVDSSAYIPFVITDKPSSGKVKPQHKVYYQPLSNWSAVYLDDDEGDVHLSNSRICCRSNYRFHQRTKSVYALFAYDGYHEYEDLKWGIQVCAIMRCETRSDLNSCGRVPLSETGSGFDHLELSSRLSTRVVFPSVLKINLHLLDNKQWDFTIKTCNESRSLSEVSIKLVGVSEPLISVSLYGRKEDGD